MPGFVRVTAASELPAQNEAKEFSVGEKVICVANVGGTFTAMDNVCLHRGGPLGQGVVDSGKIVCPWHGWQYDPKTGEAAHNSAMKAKVYPIKVEGDNVMVDLG
jgi:nitrite reductase (NADH) small subunit